MRSLVCHAPITAKCGYRMYEFKNMDGLSILTLLRHLREIAIHNYVINVDGLHVILIGFAAGRDAMVFSLKFGPIREVVVWHSNLIFRVSKAII